MTARPVSRARRRALAAGAGLVVSLVVRPASAAEDLASAIAAFTGGAPLRTGKITLDVPALVENGNAVPLTVTIDSPMTASERVAAVAIFNEKNPERGVAQFAFGPRAGRASVSTHIRLAASQRLAAVARLGDGTHWVAYVDVVVTLAACVDGDPV